MPTATEYLSTPSLGLAREVRPSQLQMAKSIEKVLKDGGVYCGEAGTGVGKSFAYLLPALLEPKRRIVIATAKKTLQDQILDKDVPAIERVVGTNYLRELGEDPDSTGPIAIALKGKGNYICQELARELAPSAEWAAFANTSAYGDWADYPGKAPKWRFAATANDCSESCKLKDECGYRRLRKDLADARVVIINHHLLGFDICYGAGEGRVLGGPYDTLIVDEAHKLTEGLRNAFSQGVSQRAIEHLRKALGRTAIGYHRGADLETAWHDMFAQLPNSYFREAYTREIPVFPEGADTSLRLLNGLEKTLYATLSDELRTEFGDYSELRTAISEVDDEDLRREMLKQARVWKRTTELSDSLQVLQGIRETEQYNAVIYSIVEENDLTGTRELRIIRAPIVTGPLAHHYFGTLKTVVLTSATLAIYNKFDHIPSVIGQKPTHTEILPSPFKYVGHGAQGFIYVPSDIPFMGKPMQRRYPDPADYVTAAADYDRLVNARVQRALHLVKLSDGGAFILTTANAELDLFADAFKTAMPGRVFAQGHSKNPHDGPPAAVFDQFKAAGPDAVLIGSKSFWEGVDVSGEQLRMVILAKLPFPIQGDPLVKARIKYWQDWALAQELCENETEAYWWAWDRVNLADMVMDLRQGTGRLIRSIHDRGLIAILDERLWTKSYAKKTRMALSFAVTNDLRLCERIVPQYVRYFRNHVQRDSHGTDSVRPVPGAAKSNTAVS